MEIDDRFPTKLDTIDDAPEPLRSALAKILPPETSIRLLVHAPGFSTLDEKTPATVLAVTDSCWLVASELDERSAIVETARFSDTLFLELTSILLSSELKVYYAKDRGSAAAAVKYATVDERYYLEALHLVLKGIDSGREIDTEKERDAAALSATWPLKLRTEAERYRPKGQRLLTALHWSTIVGGFRRELVPAGALLITDRELVVITEEKQLPRQHTGDIHVFGGIITYFPRVRLADFSVSVHERFGILALQVHAASGGEKLEIIFPADCKESVVKAMQAVLPLGN
jgi:hypothetical protein